MTQTFRKCIFRYEVIEPFSHLIKQHVLSSCRVQGWELWETLENYKFLLDSIHSYSGEKTRNNSTSGELKSA